QGRAHPRLLRPGPGAQGLVRHGFDRLLPRRVLAAGDDEALLDRAGDVVAAPGRSAARPAPARAADDDGNPVAGLDDDLLDLGREALQRVEPVLVVAADRGLASHHADVIRGAL